MMSENENNLPEYTLSTAPEYQQNPQRYRHITELAGMHNVARIMADALWQ
jgi:hypothetical protein